jgi:hypothetical protein
VRGKGHKLGVRRFANRPTAPHFPEKWGRPAAIPQQNQTPTCFFIPHHFHSRKLIPVPPSDTPDDAKSGEAGPAPGLGTLAGTDPRPAATVSLRTKGLTRVMGSDAPQNLDTLIGRTCLRGTQTRRQRCREHPDSGAKQTAGMMAEVVNDQSPIPRARVPVGLVHHPAGTSRATGQAEASSHGDAAAGPAPGHSWNASSEDRRRLARETHAAGIDAERGAGRSHINTLDRLLLAPRPRQA